MLTPEPLRRLPSKELLVEEVSRQYRIGRSVKSESLLVSGRGGGALRSR